LIEIALLDVRNEVGFETGAFEVEAFDDRAVAGAARVDEDFLVEGGSGFDRARQFGDGFRELVVVGNTVTGNSFGDRYVGGGPLLIAMAMTSAMTPAATPMIEIAVMMETAA